MPLAVPAPVHTAILQRIREAPGLPLSALVGEGSGIRPNDVYVLFSQEQIYADLYAVPLIHHRRVHLYLTSEQASTYKHLQPSRQTSRVGSPFPEGTAFLPTNTTSPKPKRTRRIGEPKPKRYAVGEPKAEHNL